MGRDLGSRRIERIDNPLPIDALGDGLTDVNIVERLEGIGHAHVEDVRLWLVDQLQIRVALDGGEVFRPGERHAEGVTALKLDESTGTLSRPVQDCGGMGRHVSVVVVVARVDNRVTSYPFLQGIGAGSDRVVERCAAGRLEVLFRLDAEHTKCDLLQECRVRLAQCELHGELVDGRDRIDATRVVLRAPGSVCDRLAFEARVGSGRCRCGVRPRGGSCCRVWCGRRSVRCRRRCGSATIF